MVFSLKNKVFSLKSMVFSLKKVGVKQLLGLHASKCSTCCRSDLGCEEPGEEMYTVYEMAREALGDTVHLRQLVSEERAERLKELGSTRPVTRAIAYS